MKFTKIAITAALAGNLFTAAQSSQASTFDLTYIAGADTVTARFDGTASGNDITNLTNISVWINGFAFNGNGTLFADSWSNTISGGTSNGFVSGGSVVSFNGADNNFFFTNRPLLNHTLQGGGLRLFLFDSKL